MLFGIYPTNTVENIDIWRASQNGIEVLGRYPDLNYEVELLKLDVVYLAEVGFNRNATQRALYDPAYRGIVSSQTQQAAALAQNNLDYLYKHYCDLISLLRKKGAKLMRHKQISDFVLSRFNLWPILVVFWLGLASTFIKPRNTQNS